MTMIGPSAPSNRVCFSGLTLIIANLEIICVYKKKSNLQKMNVCALLWRQIFYFGKIQFTDSDDSVSTGSLLVTISQSDSAVGGT